jgi:hypothetical protein
MDSIIQSANRRLVIQFSKESMLDSIREPHSILAA